MTRTFHGPNCDPGDDRTGPSGPTRRERAVVLGGFALAALWTAVAGASGADLAAAGAAWLAAVLWTVAASLACALARGIRHRDWSAFRRRALDCGRDERIDAATQSGQYAFIEVAEEHERLMRGD